MTTRKVCKKGFGCGRTCISRSRTCKSNLDAEGKKITENYTQFALRIAGEDLLGSIADLPTRKTATDNLAKVKKEADESVKQTVAEQAKPKAKPIEQEAAKPVEQEAAKPVEQEAAKPVEQEAAKPVATEEIQQIAKELEDLQVPEDLLPAKESLEDLVSRFELPDDGAGEVDPQKAKLDDLKLKGNINPDKFTKEVEDLSPEQNTGVALTANESSQDRTSGEKWVLKDIELPEKASMDDLRGKGWETIVTAAKANPKGIDAADANNAVRIYNSLSGKTDKSSDLLRAAVLRAGEPWGSGPGTGSSVRSDIHNGAKDRLDPVIKFKNKTDNSLDMDDEEFESGIALLEDGPVNGKTPNSVSATTMAAHSVMKDIYNNSTDPAQKLRMIGAFTQSGTLGLIKKEDLVFPGDPQQAKLFEKIFDFGVKLEEEQGLSMKGMETKEIREMIDLGVIDVSSIQDFLNTPW